MVEIKRLLIVTDSLAEFSLYNKKATDLGLDSVFFSPTLVINEIDTFVDENMISHVLIGGFVENESLNAEKYLEHIKKFLADKVIVIDKTNLRSQLC